MTYCGRYKVCLETLDDYRVKICHSNHACILILFKYYLPGKCCDWSLLALLCFLPLVISCEALKLLFWYEV